MKGVRDLAHELASQGLLGVFYKLADAAPEVEDACGFQGHMGFLASGGPFFGHHEKR